MKYPICETLSHKLSWSHYLELLKIDEDLERNFYEKQAILENWSIRELKRMKNSMLFHRLALSTDKEGVLRLSQEGKIVETPEDMLREPYILEFLNISQEKRITELELERKLIQHFQDFLLELGKGFAYIGRQYRITIANHHYYVDLVFYHRILKCFVLIDLKMGAADHADVGQMNLYLNYFLKEENVSDDNPPIGIISKCNEKKDNFMQCCCSVCKRP